MSKIKIQNRYSMADIRKYNTISHQFFFVGSPADANYRALFVKVPSCNADYEVLGREVIGGPYHIGQKVFFAIASVLAEPASRPRTYGKVVQKKLWVEYEKETGHCFIRQVFDLETDMKRVADLMKVSLKREIAAGERN